MKITSIIFAILILIMSCLLAPIETNSDAACASEDVFYTSCQSFYLRPLGYSEHAYADGETITQGYEVIGPDFASKIVISIESDNVTLLNDSEIIIDDLESQKYLNISFKNSDEQIGWISIYLSAYMDDGSVITGKRARIDVVSHNNKVYYSLCGLEYAKKLAGIEIPSFG